MPDKTVAGLVRVQLRLFSELSRAQLQVCDVMHFASGAQLVHFDDVQGVACGSQE